MKIELKEITIKELAEGYKDNSEAGVVGYGGRLDIRPPYQREFVYKDDKRNAVINTVTQNFPLNVMYWAVRDDGNYEIIDGQQRTISICQYIKGDFSFNKLYFHNLPKDKQDNILNYKLMVYFCSGTDSERLDWFKTINIAGEKLTDQELRNAVYPGSWLSDAKRYFSKTGCVAYNLANNYMNGSPIRQEYLETVIDWISNGKIEEYMATHQHQDNANELWEYFKLVIEWVQKTFHKPRKEMKGIEWGHLYNTYKNDSFDNIEIEKRILKLIDDDEVQSIRGIYLYILTKQEKYLSLRQFDDRTKGRVFEKQKGICPMCKKEFTIKEMEADHIIPWHKGGKTVIENCQMLCMLDNRTKSGK